MSVKYHYTKSEPSREAGLAALDEFLPKVAAYAAERNFDRPGHGSVSRLSSYLARRILSEAEVCDAVLKRFSFATVEKFVQEVFWRSYWKGWLEQRPSVWQDYRSRLVGLSKELEDSTPVLLKQLEMARAGQTGIECFDYWANELVETNYLHNHARMWFASIWIFTLRLPWELGADFFYRHLLDADPASNTLSWRWVAGLQTIGKHYLARAENIARFTKGRFNPAGQLNESAAPLMMESAHPRPQLDLPRDSFDLNAAQRSGLLLLGDDLSPEASPLGAFRWAGVAGGWDASIGDAFNLAPAVQEFSKQAIESAVDRAGAYFEAPSRLLDCGDWTQSVLNWASEEGFQSLVVSYPAVGPWADRLRELRQRAPASLPVKVMVRPWDRDLWPLAKAGFFKFRQAIPNYLNLC